MVGTEMRKCRVVDLVKRDYRITGVKISTGEVIPATRVVLVLGKCKEFIILSITRQEIRLPTHSKK